jgi:hypothetical protein
MAAKASTADKDKTGTDEAPETKSKSATTAAAGDDKGTGGGNAGGLSQADIDKLVSEAHDKGKAEATAEHAKEAEGKRLLSDEEIAELVAEANKGKTVLTAEELEKLETEQFRKGYNEALDDQDGAAQTTETAGGLTAGGGVDWARASLIGVALRLPENLRRGGLRPVVDELGSFMASVPEELIGPAAEFVRAIAEARPDDIVSGRFKVTVNNALAVLTNEDEEISLKVDPDSQRAAAARLASIQGNPVPSGWSTEKIGEAAIEGQDAVGSGQPSPDPDDKEAARSRLYSRQGGE